MMPEFFGRKLVIATMHGKEQVMAPLLQSELGAVCYCPGDFDTDAFGTFTGETERTDTPVNTLRMKCLNAMEIYGIDLGVASEGSFGPHSSFFFTHADEEWVMLIDRKNNLEILERELSSETNFNGRQIGSEDVLAQFANECLFPSHGLILRNSEKGTAKIVKGIMDRDELFKAYREILGAFGTVYAETDMRACYNPTRMKVIGRTSEKLIKKIKSRCPSCSSPGYGVTGVSLGLPCVACIMPTQSVLFHILNCGACGHSTESVYPHNRQFEDPTFCDYCNP